MLPAKKNLEKSQTNKSSGKIWLKKLFLLQMDAQCDVLVSEQAGYILQRTGMSQLYNNVLQHKAEQVNMPELTCSYVRMTKGYRS